MQYKSLTIIIKLLVMNNNCVLHPDQIQNLVCTYDTCQHKLICCECSKVHKEIHDEGYVYPFAKLLQIHSGNKFTQLKKELVSQKDTLDRALRSKLDSTGPSGRLEAKVKECEESIGVAIQQYIRVKAKQVKSSIQQYEGNLQKSQLKNPQKMIPKLVKELNNEAQLIDECRRDTRAKLRMLHEWVQRGLDEIELFNYEVDIIIDTIDKRKEEVLRKLNDNFRPEDQNSAVNLDVNVNQMAIDRNESFEAKYTKMKRVGWQNQRLSVQIDKLNKRMVAKDRKVEHYEKQNDDLLKKIKTLQIELDKKTKNYLQLEKSKEVERMKQQQLQKDQRKQLQEMLLQKGVNMMGEVKQIDLHNKRINPDELRLIAKNFSDILLLDLSDNRMAESQLQTIFTFTQLKTLKLNFSKISPKFVKKICVSFPELKALSLDSNNIDDDLLVDICTIRLVTLSLIDNKITDSGGQLIANRLDSLEQLYLSYNMITHRSVEPMSKYLYRLRVLHLARNKVRNKGALQIAKGLKQLEVLFLGGCQITKQGCLPIARNNFKLRRLSIGQNELGTEVIFELIMCLIQLEWLEISYCGLTDLEVDRIQKLCANNQKLQLVVQQN